MERNELASAYANININSPDDLFDYVIKHNKICINNIEFDLTHSNEIMEFMAMFLSLSKYKILRLYFEKKLSNGEIFRHWFLVFETGGRWYYFEPLLEQLRGQYGFDSYNEIMFFVVNRLNQEFNVENNNYTLKEISSLNNFVYEDNIKQSLDGTEIFINEYLTPRTHKETNPVNFNRSGTSKNENYSSDGVKIFILGFFMTIVICVFVSWLVLKAKGIV